VRDVVLRTVGLTKLFGRITAVKDLHLELYRGDVFGFLGPNGSGKTTTIGMVLGLIAPTRGYVELFGHRLERCPASLFRKIGVVLENPPLYPFLSGRDNLEAAARLAGVNDPGRIDRLLERVGLGERASDKVKTYSLGMKQRLSLAAALLTDPELLILDEPTNGMDPNGMMEVRELIRELGREGKTVFLSSHLLHEVQQVCSRVAIIKRGEVLAQGRVDELLRRGRVLQIRVPEPERAAAVVRGLEWVSSVDVEGGMLLVEVHPERAQDVSAALAQRGIYPSEMRFREESLESFFREVTREEG
jgi:ABC-2 type transport system ATP-binding protein